MLTLVAGFTPAAVVLGTRRPMPQRPLVATAAPTTASSAGASTAGTRTFCRASDLLASGPKVSAIDVVNVLGRWQRMEASRRAGPQPSGLTFDGARTCFASQEWDSIGELPAMDAFFDAEGNIVDGPALRDAWARWEEAFPRKASRLSSETRTSKLPRWPKNDPQFSAPNVEKAGAQPWAARTPQRRGFCKRKHAQADRSTPPRPPLSCSQR